MAGTLTSSSEANEVDETEGIIHHVLDINAINRLDILPQYWLAIHYGFNFHYL